MKFHFPVKLFCLADVHLANPKARPKFDQKCKRLPQPHPTQIELPNLPLLSSNKKSAIKLLAEKLVQTSNKNVALAQKLHYS
jgi:hypothetical protein